MGGRGLQSDTHLVCSVVSITWFLVRTIKFLVPLLVPTTALRLFRFFPLAPSTSSLHHKKDDCFRRWGARCMDFSSCCFHIRARRGVADRRSCTITKPLVNNSSDSNTVGSIIRVIFTLIFLFMLLLVARLLCETFLCTWIEDFWSDQCGLCRRSQNPMWDYLVVVDRKSQNMAIDFEETESWK